MSKPQPPKPQPPKTDDDETTQERPAPDDPFLGFPPPNAPTADEITEFSEVLDGGTAAAVDAFTAPKPLAGGGGFTHVADALDSELPVDDERVQCRSCKYGWYRRVPAGMMNTADGKLFTRIEATCTRFAPNHIVNLEDGPALACTHYAPASEVPHRQVWPARKIDELPTEHPLLSDHGRVFFFEHDPRPDLPEVPEGAWIPVKLGRNHEVTGWALERPASWQKITISEDESGKPTQLVGRYVVLCPAPEHEGFYLYGYHALHDWVRWIRDGEGEA